MWELELLSRVVPAFGALARQDYMKRMEDEHDYVLLRDAQNCWQDLVLIGSYIYTSGGEWASGLDDKIVAKLLEALEVRLPRKWHFLTIWKPNGVSSLSLSWFCAELTYDAQTPQTGPGTLQFLKLADLASSMKSLKLGGYDECYEIESQSDDQRQKYIDVLGPGVSLFRGEELDRKDKLAKRAKFLKRIRAAVKHLSDVYCPENVSGEVHGLSLSKHPSHGAKAAADKLYKSLQRHWRCNCPRRATDTIGSREARLSLTRYRQFATIVAQNPLASLSFEVVLPIFKDSVEWKVTNFEVKGMK
jgi:hypothetical protein